jgi:hydrogenase maturation protein HypF
VAGRGDAAGDPVDATARLLREGRWWRQGLGGFHLACDAGNGAAVAALRAGKAREAKPFALMARWSRGPVRGIGAGRGLAELGRAHRAVAAPMASLPLALAPGQDHLGMLPATPLHHALADALAGRW